MNPSEWNHTAFITEYHCRFKYIEISHVYWSLDLTFAARSLSMHVKIVDFILLQTSSPSSLLFAFFKLNVYFSASQISMRFDQTVKTLLHFAYVHARCAVRMKYMVSEMLRKVYNFMRWIGHENIDIIFITENCVLNIFRCWFRLCFWLLPRPITATAAVLLRVLSLRLFNEPLIRQSDVILRRSKFSKKKDRNGKSWANNGSRNCIPSSRRENSDSLSMFLFSRFFSVQVFFEMHFR